MAYKLTRRLSRRKSSKTMVINNFCRLCYRITILWFADRLTWEILRALWWLSSIITCSSTYSLPLRSPSLPVRHLFSPSLPLKITFSIDWYYLEQLRLFYVFAGFNPMWKEKFEKVLLMPELTMIRFAVFDEDVGIADDFIGQFSIPFTSLRPGICVRWNDRSLYYRCDLSGICVLASKPLTTLSICLLAL